MLPSSRSRGFTLIELLTVMVIILVLAALVLALVGYGQTKAARSKAEGQIAALSNALESYKTDNGTYPRALPGAAAAASPASDMLDARLNGDPNSGSGQTGSYKAASAILYRCLSGDTQGNTQAAGNGTPSGGSSSTPYAKTYYNFNSSDLAYDSGVYNYVVDPFGNSYGYSTAYQADLDANTNPPTRGYNPTFDLWSTSGYGTGAKNYPASMNSSVPAQAALWIKNW